jgi:hypothetical protein
VLASLVCTQRTTFTYASNPSQLAQADGRQGRQSIYKGSLVHTVNTRTRERQPSHVADFYCYVSLRKACFRLGLGDLRFSIALGVPYFRLIAAANFFLFLFSQARIIMFT